MQQILKTRRTHEENDKSENESKSEKDDQKNKQEKIRIELVFPFLPTRINEWSGSSHFTKWAEAKRWKKRIGEAFVLNYPALLNSSKLPLKKAKITCIRATSGKCDFDGLVISFKSLVDALKTNKIIVDDSMDVIGAPEYRAVKAPPGKGWVSVTVEEA